MAFPLKNRSLLTIEDLTQAELCGLLDLARDLKQAKAARSEQRLLVGKSVCLIFEKTSTRTRCAFDVACFDQGANVSYLGPSGSQMGHKESARDTARVVGRMYDAIAFRGFSQRAVEEIAAYGRVPVYNGLTDELHPTQMLADVMTMREHTDKPLDATSFAFLGDTRSNMGNSLMITGGLMGMDVRLCGPKSLWPRAPYLERATALAAANGGRITVTDDPSEAVQGVDFIHTDVWVSMGEPKGVWAERVALLKNYRVDRALMDATGNLGTRFMHCLPAFHDLETEVARDMHALFGLEAMEVTDEVFESEASIVFDQAENRMHTIKALLVATLAD